mmetsp:Transcript_41478/g.99383  ORF Transcript_41478/g.99383 Transcript_41478/m.99383 type:complete len:506 (+) Transcript_41478:225-1742(+)
MSAAPAPVPPKKTAEEVAAKIAASATEPVGTATTTTTTRGRSTTATDSSRERSRSKSLSRQAKKAGSKLRGIVKSGMKSLRNVGSGSSTRSKDGMDSRDSSLKSGLNSLAGAEIDLLNSGTAGAAAAASASTSTAQLELVVLLMDPTTRRFELLQLEFDSPKAKVSDLLTQIPASVTEPALKSDSVEFVGVLDHTGVVVEGSTKLLNAFGGSNATTTTTTKKSTKIVLVAKPKGVSSKETIRLARPILTDKQVSKMLSSTGFDVTGWKSLKRSSSITMKGKKSSIVKASVTTSPDSPVDLDAVHDEVAASRDDVPKNSIFSMTLLAVAVVLICLQLVDQVWTHPIPSDVVLTIGTYRSRCGVLGLIPADVRGSIKEGWESNIPDIEAPSFLSCENEFLQISYAQQQDMMVTATLSNDDGVVDMILLGYACDDSVSNDDESKCVDGLVLNSSTNAFEIGGRPLKSATIYHSKSKKSLKSVADKQTLSPWPFVDRPLKQKFKIKPRK